VTLLSSTLSAAFLYHKLQVIPFKKFYTAGGFKERPSSVSHNSIPSHTSAMKSVSGPAAECSSGFLPTFNGTLPASKSRVRALSVFHVLIAVTVPVEYPGRS